jgi:predicted outer membrane lipoprotein
MAFAVLLCAYFAWLLFLRLQCSLLEWIVLIAFLGNAEGLLVTTPGFGAMKAVWALAPLVAAWVLYGMVKGLVWADILGVSAPGRRIGLLFLAWFQTAAPAMVLAGAMLLLGRQARGLVSRDLAAWGLPLLIAGALGILARLWLERRVARAAQSILDAATPAPE